MFSDHHDNPGSSRRRTIAFQKCQFRKEQVFFAFLRLNLETSFDTVARSLEMPFQGYKVISLFALKPMIAL